MCWAANNIPPVCMYVKKMTMKENKQWIAAIAATQFFGSSFIPVTVSSLWLFHTKDSLASSPGHSQILSPPTAAL